MGFDGSHFPFEESYLRQQDGEREKHLVRLYTNYVASFPGSLPAQIKKSTGEPYIYPFFIRIRGGEPGNEGTYYVCETKYLPTRPITYLIMLPIMIPIKDYYMVQIIPFFCHSHYILSQYSLKPKDFISVHIMYFSEEESKVLSFSKLTKFKVGNSFNFMWRYMYM